MYLKKQEILTSHHRLERLNDYYVARVASRQIFLLIDSLIHELI